MVMKVLIMQKDILWIKKSNKIFKIGDIIHVLKIQIIILN